ncbi:probable ATP-dependent RNA helicase DDX49 [Argiope bruennichi]|uniref:RNA helicase n=1 Tax=Argiope bruennichi TaxID=94029 RepID=A0A8T0DY95_ARGBR|nr:probable ATP-dependent RNA helicase DDX49 [Argiope bruennichi]KAF8763488.1 putative ATP-dependent RNA helicase DDX49 like protein [Argiope bruennichi]
MSAVCHDEGFKEFNLKEWIVKQCTEMGITKPTPVQYHCIPPIMEGKGCVAISKTGTGKTLAFVLPMLHKWCSDPVSKFGLILTPTRELARQIYDQIKVIGKPVNIQVCLIIGGENQVEQGAQIAKGPHIIVATPGRLSDMIQSGYERDFKYIKMLVVDEADRMLNGSFTEDLEVIMAALPKKRQTLLFSATMTPMVENAIKHGHETPFVWKGEADVTTVTELDQRYVFVHNPVLRSGYLVKIINDYQAKTPDSSMIIFTKNCEVCQIVSEALKKLGFDNVALNSNLKQRERSISITRFKSNRIKILVATDLASRGLDIPMVDLVVNYSVPPVPANYVHRVGRTARAGRGGLAFTLLTPKEINRLINIEKNINYKLQEFKVSEKKVLEIALQVEVTFREAAINLQYDETVERKEINKRKRIILEGGEIYVKSKRQKKKNNKKLRNSGESTEIVSLDAVAALGGDVSTLRTQSDEEKTTAQVATQENS